MAEPRVTSDAPIVIDLSGLTLADMQLEDDFVGTADLSVRQERDARGAYSLLEFAPRPGMSAWITAVIGLPQFEITHGLESIELEAWNPGVPLKLVADATDPRCKCFEFAFCENDTVWEGWKTFTARSTLERPVLPPVRLKWLVVIMRQGLAWKLGLRGLRIGPVRRAVPAFKGMAT